MKRFVSVVLLLALILGCLPVSVLADDTALPEAEAFTEDAPAEDVPAVLASEEGGFFYFSAESDGKLLVAPVKISFASEQSIQDALTAAGIELGFSSGMLTTVNGTSENYQWLPGEVTSLDQTPPGTYFCIYTGAERSSIGNGWKALMQQMEAYTHEEADVQQAAKAAYESAYNSYPGADDVQAKNLADALENAISDYKTGLKTEYPVTFSQFTGSEYDIYAVNAYGKRVDGANGSIELPNGAYTFYIYRENKAVSGSLTVNGGAKTISSLPEIPTDAWINESAFQISTESGSVSPADFDPGIISTTKNGEHSVSATLYDTFSGSLYPYVEISSSLPKDALSVIYTNAATGEEVNKPLTPKSKATAISNVLAKGASGNTVIFRASKEESGYTLLEDFTLTLGRTLTLSGLRVTNAGGTPQVATESFSPDRTAYTYKVLDSEETLNIYPTPSASDVTVTVNNAALNESGYASVDISDTAISVVLKAGDYTSTYTLTIQTGAASRVKLTLENADSVVVKNSSGDILTPQSSTANSQTYALVVGQQYSYYATRDSYYHVEQTFTLTKEGVLSGYKVDVPADKMPSLSALQVSTAKEHSTAKLALDRTFASTEHKYTTTVADSDSNIYAWAAPEEGSSAECTVSYNIISRQTADGTAAVVTLTGNLLADGTQLEKVLLTQNAYGNTLTFNVAQSKKDATGTTTYSTDYVLTVKRALTLQNLEISGATLSFSGAEKNYTITVPAADKTLSLTATAWNNSRYNGTDGGYVLAANGTSIASGKTAEIPLSGDSSEETVTVTVKSRDELSEDTTYTIKVMKAAGSTVTFNVKPTEALLYIFDKDTGSRVWPDENGSCAIFTGHTYGYSVTKQGYAGTSGYFQLENSTLVFGTIQSGEFVKNNVTHDDIKTPYSISLTAAPESTRKQFKAEWPDFRGNANNNGVTDAKTPVNAEDGTLYWATLLGSGYGAGAVSNPILVGGDLVVYKGNSILKIDKDTGEIKTTGTMAGSSSYAINGPTYADGVILVGLSNGRVQAFNAETLESLWVYYDPLGGQPNCPITVHDGCAYTGFWNSETKDAAFVCLSLTDEDSTNTQESKPATWRYVQKGGFYWAGAYACDEFVMVGTDDGTSGMDSTTANLLLLDPKTGKLLDSKTELIGDIRSSICYDSATNAYYFTTKGGYFYKVTVDKQTGGTYKLGDPEKISLGGMSTSTPVISNGRAYVGVSGAKQFGGSGYNITVIDLGSWKAAYRMLTNGYPQTSGLLTTAYDGFNYVYFFENAQPGTLRLLRDQSGQTAADTTYQTKEDAGTTAYALFTPISPQAQYAICSPIADEAGTLYFKNDSGYLMAFGSAIKPDTLKVVSQPTKLVYQAGDNFDKTGLKVTAEFTDGTTRDVTKLMEQEVLGALTEGTTEVTLKYAPTLTMYHNKQNTDKTMTAGEETDKPTVKISITVGGVSDSIGTVNWGYAANRLTLSGTFPSGAKLIAASYDETGKMTAAKVFTAIGSAEISGAKIRLFLLDSTGKPLCSSVTVTGA